MVYCSVETVKKLIHNNICNCNINKLIKKMSNKEYEDIIRYLIQIDPLLFTKLNIYLFDRGIPQNILHEYKNVINWTYFSRYHIITTYIYENFKYYLKFNLMISNSVDPSLHSKIKFYFFRTWFFLYFYSF